MRSHSRYSSIVWYYKHKSIIFTNNSYCCADFICSRLKAHLLLQRLYCLFTFFSSIWLSLCNHLCFGNPSPIKLSWLIIAWKLHKHPSFKDRYKWGCCSYQQATTLLRLHTFYSFAYSVKLRFITSFWTGVADLSAKMIAILWMKEVLHLIEE